MASFDKAFAKIVKAEGGYINDKNDAGGETYLGISRRYHTDSKIWEYIDAIKKANPKATNRQLTTIIKKNSKIEEECKYIYRSKYWDKLRCGEIRSQKLADQLFDMGVNAGTTNAVKLMQHIMGIRETGIVSLEFIQDVNKYVQRNKIHKI